MNLNIDSKHLATIETALAHHRTSCRQRLNAYTSGMDYDIDRAEVHRNRYKAAQAALDAFRDATQEVK